MKDRAEGQQEREYRQSQERPNYRPPEKEMRRSRDRVDYGQGEMRRASAPTNAYDDSRQTGDTRMPTVTGRGYEETMRTYRTYADEGRDRDRDRDRSRDNRR